MTRLLILLCVTTSLLCLINGVNSMGCPFASFLQDGRQQSRMIDATKKLLIRNNFSIEVGEPANSIWATVALPPEVRTLYNKTNSLLIAQQLFLAERQNVLLTVDDKLDLLKRHTHFVDESERCHPKWIPCNPANLYATVNGFCNNLNNQTWGGQYTQYGRLVPANYDDGIYTIRRGINNQPLPSPRLLGNLVLQQSVYEVRPPITQNYGSLIFGQYITHDVGWRDTYQNDEGGDGLRCCPKDYQTMLPDYLSYHGCYAIEVPRDDPFYSNYNMGCLSYIRSQPIFSHDCSLGPAELSNAVTSFLDHSNIYGSERNAAESVRLFSRGKLRLENDIMALTPNCTGPFCYFTGDNRGSFYPTLGLWHSIFIRFHNNIADQLSLLNPHWNDEKCFQETRRILTAVYQNIVYNEWLPYYIGKEAAERRNLSCKNSGYCGRYDAHVDPSNMNEFAHGAFRLFHANTPENVNFYNDEYVITGSEPLYNMTNGVNILETSYDAILRGLLWDPAYFGKYPDNLRNTVFNNDNLDGIGMDLLSVDIARGRDHGLQPYHVYLNLAIDGGHPIADWNDYAPVFTAESIENLRSVYASPLDVDLLVGLLLEAKNGEYSGPVTTYIMEEQFYRFKYGDRFFYSLANNANRFTEAQIREINKQTFASVLCQNSNEKIMLPNAFEVESEHNQFVSCESLGQLNVDLWETWDETISTHIGI